MHRVDFESLFERLPSPHMVLDRDLCFVAANPAYEAATGRSRSELIGKPLFEMFPNEGESGRKLRESLGRVFDTGESDTLAFLPYDIPRVDARGFETRYWTAVHTPLRSHQGETLYILQNTVDVTEIVRMREAAATSRQGIGPELQLVERAREAERAQRTAIAESSEFRRLFRQAPQMMAVLTGPSHVFTFTNDAYRRFVGERDFIGKPVREAMVELDDQGFFGLLDEVYTNGTEISQEGIRLTVDQGLDEPQETFLDFSLRPMHDAEGEISGVFVQGMDRTEMFRHLRHQRLLLDELNHRVNNTLATVQSIASQTLRTAGNLQDARRDRERRIIALSRAHNLLTARSWQGIDLRALAEVQVSPYASGRFTVSGEEIRLNPPTAIALAMMLHELADNAARHGALSGDQGSVALSWQKGAEGRLLVNWRETDGPTVAGPVTRGFGMRIMDRVARSELGGTLDMDFSDDGFACRIELPDSAYARTENATISP